MNFVQSLNYYGKNKIPFLFLISYDKKDYNIIPLKELKSNIKYSIKSGLYNNHNILLNTINYDYSKYKEKFLSVIKNIKKGNTYIFNLTIQTKIEDILNLEYLYKNSNAKYKLLYKNKFLSFSPETFIKISNNKISSYPMKGTIDASIKNAKNIILDDKKELAEHTMIVDLIRNDLSILCNDIKVERFRYCEKIKAGSKELYQVSSHISATLENNWHENIGDILNSLLPAGSITGTPKKSTVDLINKIEDYKRGYFTGVWGVYDGENLDSSVLIRFIQKNENSFVYKSGGGITIDSDCLCEYNEMIDKIYIP